MLCGIIGYTRKSSCAISHHLFFDHRCRHRALPMDSERTTERPYVWNVRRLMPSPALQAKFRLFHRKRRKTAFYHLHFFRIGRMSIEGGVKVTKQSIVVCDSGIPDGMSFGCDDRLVYIGGSVPGKRGSVFYRHFEQGFPKCLRVFRQRNGARKVLSV